jgi:hypothetical protein
LKLPDTPETKEKKSVFRQLCALDIYMVGRSMPDDLIRGHAQFFFDTALVLANQDIPLGREMIKLLDGARAQAAMMRFLEDQGYTVYVPDPEDPKEIVQWDIRAGIDFIAVSPDGSVYMIDTKGYEFDPENPGQMLHVARIYTKEPLDNPQSAKIQGSSQAIILSAVARELQIPSIPPLKTHYIEITLPADPEYISKVGIITSKDIQQTVDKGLPR